MYGRAGSLLLGVGLLRFWPAGATLRCLVQASRCGGFSCCGAWVLRCLASVAAVHGSSRCNFWVLESWLCSCDAWA